MGLRKVMELGILDLRFWIKERVAKHRNQESKVEIEGELRHTALTRWN